jgi:hypothetical protein
MKIASIAAVASLASSLAFAGNVPGTAKGTFKSQGVTMEVKSAIAYRGKSFFDKQDALIVAITNAQMTDAIADYYDRRLALDKRIKDAQTGLVFLEFKPDGAFRGFSYYFASGNGCGFCSGETMSSVKLAGGKLAGSLQSTEKDRAMNVTLDVPIMSDDHGAALAGDGGAAGAAYLAYHTALLKKDRAALKQALSADLRDTMADAEKKNDMDGFVRWLLREHPDKSVKIVKGYAKGDTAVLVITGESSSGKLAGEVMMRKEDGRWRVDDEMTDVVLE